MKAARLAAIRAANAQKQDSVILPRSAATSAADSRGAAAVAPAAPAQAPTVPITTLGLLLLAAVIGAFLATFAIPGGLPGLSASLLGPEPKAYWYLARSSGFVAYGLLWLSMTLGLMMTTKLARLWPGGPATFALHQHASILGLAFGLFHALILLGDRYSNFTLSQILIPFASPGANSLWVGLGQLSLYLMGIIGLSFYVRPLIGRSVWRLIHVISFVIFGLVLCHGVLSGSDSGTIWAQAIYWLSGGSVLFLTLDRVLARVLLPAARPASARPAPREMLAEA
jgi:predicted ferric reductase